MLIILYYLIGKTNPMYLPGRLSVAVPRSWLDFRRQRAEGRAGATHGERAVLNVEGGPVPSRDDSQEHPRGYASCCCTRPTRVRLRPVLGCSAGELG